MKWVLSRTSYDFVLISHRFIQLAQMLPNPPGFGWPKRSIRRSRKNEKISSGVFLTITRAPGRSSPSRPIARRAEVAPRYERAQRPRRSPLVATRRSSRSRDASRGRSASRLRRTRARNPRRGSIGNRARGSSAARPGRHPRTPALDTRRARARRSGRTPRD